MANIIYKGGVTDFFWEIGKIKDLLTRTITLKLLRNQVFVERKD